MHHHTAAPALAALLLAAPVLGSPDAPGAGTLLDFEMEDQFGAVHRRADHEGRVVVVIGSGKGGSDWNKAGSSRRPTSGRRRRRT